MSDEKSESSPGEIDIPNLDIPDQSETPAAGGGSKSGTSSSGGQNLPQKTRRFGDEDANVVIETKNLSKVYRDFWGRAKVNALKALDLEVSKRRNLWDCSARMVRVSRQQ